MYKRGEYYKADVTIDAVFTKYPNTIITDKLSLLRALILAKRNKITQYERALVSFTKEYKTSELLTFVTGLQAQLTNSTSNKELSTPVTVIDTSFVFNLGEEHYFITFLSTNGLKYRELLGDFYAHNVANHNRDALKTNLYKFGNDLSILRVGSFPLRQMAENYRQRINKRGSFFHKYGKIEKESFIITRSNLNILLASKDLKGYKLFYESRYKKNNS